MLKIEGRNPVIELLRSKRYIKRIMLEEGINEKDEKISEIIKRARNRSITIEYTAKKQLVRFSDTKNHQGVIALALIGFEDLGEVITEQRRHKNPLNFVYIREALYEDNIGAIARSVEAAGFTGVILSPKQNLTAQMFRSSMGALANVTICRESLFTAIKLCQKELIQVVGIELFTENIFTEVDLVPDTMLIIGGEDRSLSPEIMKKCDTVVKIPMYGKINSLNMTVAASIVVFEKLRQVRSRISS